MVRRDAITAWSYRLNFLLQGASALFGAALWFFFSSFAKPAPGAVPGGEYFAYIILGMVLIGYLNVMLHTFSGKISQEKMGGTLEMFLASPAPAFGLLWASAMWELAVHTVNALFLLGGAFLFGARFHCGSPAALVLVGILFAASTAALGIMAASLLLVFQKGEPVTPFVGAFVALLGNVFFPSSVLPAPLQAASQILPITHALKATRAIVLEGRGLADVGQELAILAGFCCVLLPASYWAFRACLGMARRYGLLAQY